MKYILFSITCLVFGLFISLSDTITIFPLDTQAQQKEQQSTPNQLITSYTVTSLDNNKPVSIANTTGDVILLNSWATWCLPCREEMPGLEQLHNEFQSKGLQIVGVSVDSPRAENMIKSFVHKMGLTYIFWHDPNNNFARLFKSLGVPESYLVDKEGNIFHQWKGPFDPISNGTKSIVNNALSAVSLETTATTTDAIVETIENIDTEIPDPTNLNVDTNLNKLQNDITIIGIPLAFVAGLLSFLSPCILPLIPSYIAFITGMSSEELLKNKRREKEGNQYKSSSYHNKGTIRDGDYTTTSSSSRRSESKKLSDSTLKISIIKSQTFIRGCLFILGFSIVFVALGASITAIGSVFHEYSVWIERIGGILLIIFGLNLLGVLKIPGTQRDWGFKFSKRPAGHIGALLIGMGFGAGWTPCIGPILASILTLAATTTSIYEGISLLVFYSMGLAVPFILSTLAIDKYMFTFHRIRKWMPWIHRSSAGLIIAMGILLLTGFLTLFTNSLASYIPMFG